MRLYIRIVALALVSLWLAVSVVALVLVSGLQLRNVLHNWLAHVRVPMEVVLRQMRDFVRVHLRTFILVENKRRLGAYFSLVLREQALRLNSLRRLPENVCAVSRVLHHQKLDLSQRV